MLLHSIKAANIDFKALFKAYPIKYLEILEPLKRDILSFSLSGSRQLKAAL